MAQIEKDRLLLSDLLLPWGDSFFLLGVLLSGILWLSFFFWFGVVLALLCALWRRMEAMVRIASLGSLFFLNDYYISSHAMTFAILH